MDLSRPATGMSSVKIAAPFFLVLSASLACAAWAEEIAGSLEIDLTRLVASSGDKDWNDDGHADQLLLVVAAQADAMDLVMVMSDPLSDGAGRTEQRIAAVVPAVWPRAENDLYSFGYTLEPDPLHPIIYAMGGEISLDLTLSWSDHTWEVDQVSSRHETDQDALICFLDYTKGEGIFDRFGDDERRLVVGARPTLAAYWWREALPDECWG